MSQPSWRTKSFVIKLAALAVSVGWLCVCLLLGDTLSGWAAALVGVGVINASTWWLLRRFVPVGVQHLNPREWEELRGALEDVPVLSVLHIFSVDRSRLERFRYIPTLKRYLWESLSEDVVDPNRVVRAAFLLHTFGESLQGFAGSLNVIKDPVVHAYISDLILEPARLQQRVNMRRCAEMVPQLVECLGDESVVAGFDDNPEQAAAWRLLLLGPIAYEAIHEGLEHENPRVRESCLALMALQPEWPSQHKDLMKRINRDPHPLVKRASLELLAATDHPRVTSILQSMAQDPTLGPRCVDLLRERLG